MQAVDYHATPTPPVVCIQSGDGPATRRGCVPQRHVKVAAAEIDVVGHDGAAIQAGTGSLDVDRDVAADRQVEEGGAYSAKVYSEARHASGAELNFGDLSVTMLNTSDGAGPGRREHPSHPCEQYDGPYCRLGLTRAYLV